MKKLILLVLAFVALGSFVPMAEAASSKGSTNSTKHHKKHSVKHKKHHHTVKKTK